MTTNEVKDALRRGSVIGVIIPIGSTEQHGPHLPLNTDSIIAESIAYEVSKRFKQFLVLPTLDYGFSAYHLGFPGTISISKDILTNLLVEITKNLIDEGFQKIIYVSGHGGNFESCNRACHIINERYRNRFAISYPDFKEFSHQISLPCLEAGIPQEEVGAHAGTGETSLMLYLAPDKVRMNLVERGATGNVDVMRKIMHEQGIDKVSPIGVIGNPKLAKAEYGKRGFENVVNLISNYILENL